MRYLIILTFMSFIYVYGSDIPKNNWEEVYKQTKDKEVIESLFKLTEDFEKVEFDGEKLILDPKPVVKSINITGNRSFWDSEIKAITGLREGSPVEPDVLENIPLRIKQFYYDKGFFAATVDVKYRQEKNWIFVSINIDEGKKSKLKDIHFLTDQKVSFVELETFKKAMGLTYGKELNFTALENGIDKLRDYLTTVGYYDSYTEITKIDAKKDGYLSVAVSINFGTKYIVKFDGNRSIDDESLRKLLTFKNGGFNYYQIGVSLQNIIRRYQDDGYLDVHLSFDIQESEEKFEDMYPVFTILNIHIDEGNRYKVGKVDVASDIQDIQSQITGVIGNKTFYDRKNLEDLLEKTVASLKKDGYLNAYYMIEENPQGSDTVNLNVDIFKKERYILKSVSFKNFPVDRRSITIKTPKIYSPAEVLDFQDRLKKMAVDDGYYDAEVLLDVEMERKDGKIEVDVVYNFELGERYKNGFTFVYGSKYLNPTVVLNQFEGQGEFFSNQKTEIGLDRLYASKLFESVNLYILEDRKNKIINRAILLHDDKRGLFQGSVGYSTDQQFKVSLLGVLKNLFGYGYEFSGYFERSNFQTNYKASVGNRLLPNNLSSFVSVYSSQQFRRYFDLKQEGIELNLEKRHNMWVNSLLIFSHYYASVQNSSIQTDLNNYRINKISLVITDDHRHQKVDTKRGYTLSAKLEKTFGEVSFSKGEVGGRHFFNFTDYVVASQKLSFGHIFSDIDAVPVGERYFIGGISSLRGFGLEEVAGKDKIGGNSFVLLNNDIRFLVYPKYSLYLLGFFDLGNVYKDKNELKTLYLRKSAGLGVYLPTPVGAVILDVARKLDLKPGEDRYRIEFSIGTNF